MPKISTILIFGLLVFVISEGILLSAFNLKALSFCWSRNCIDFAIGYFSLLFKVAYIELVALGFIVGLAKLHTAEQSLTQQTVSAKTANFVAHFEHFQRLAYFETSRRSYLRELEISFPTLHAAFFPDEALVSPDRSRLNDTLVTWRKYVIETSYGASKKGPSNMNWVEHRRLVEPWMRHVGIEPGEPENNVFWSIEKEVYDFFQFLRSIGGGVAFPTDPAYLPRG